MLMLLKQQNAVSQTDVQTDSTGHITQDDLFLSDEHYTFSHANVISHLPA